VRRIAGQRIGQRRLGLGIAAPWGKRLCRGSALAGDIRVAEQRFADRRVRLPESSGLFFIAATSTLDSLL
jgi:hypothetical protein